MKNKINYLYIVFLCIFFNILFSFTYNLLNGPLMFNSVSQTGDPSLFQYLGYMFYKGKLPYVDFWDHKGFYLILYESITFFMPFDHNFSTALTSVITISIGCILSMKLAERYHDKKISIITISLATLFAFIWNTTNTVEEIMLPFIALIGMFTLRYIENTKKGKLSFKESILIGLFVGILFNIRVKEALIGIVPVVIVIYNELYKNKDLKLFIQYSLICLLGFIVPFIPIFIYFGMNGALSDWFYANIGFSFVYANSGSLFTDSSFFSKVFLDTRGLIFMPLLCSLLLNIKHYKDKVYDLKDLFIISYTLIIFVIIITGMSFSHYLYIGIPLLFIFFELIIDNIKRYIKEYKTMPIKERIPILVISLYTLFFVITGIIWDCNIKIVTVNQLIKKEPVASLSQDLLEIRDITGKDINELYFHDCSSNIYAQTNTTPNQKYVGYQTWWVKFDERIRDEINSEIENSDYIVWCKHYDPSRIEYNKYIENDNIEIIEDNDKYTITKKQD